MNEQSVRLRLGIFVLGALVLLAVLIMLFGGWGRFFQHYHHYTVTFPNAAGVGVGTPVRRSGVRIGEVESVELDNKTGLVRVGIKVSADHVVRKSDQPVIAHGLLGDTTIDFVPRPQGGQAADTGPVPAGSTLQGSARPEAGNLAQQGAELVPAARDTLEEMRKSFERFNKTLPVLDETLREYQALGKAVRDLVPEARRTNDEFQITARNWGKVAERMDVMLQTNEKKLTATLDRLDDAARRVAAMFSDENQKNLTETLKNARDSSTRLDSITRNTDELVKEGRKTVDQLNGSVAKMNEVLGNLEQATRPLAQRTDRITRNLDEAAEKLNLLLGDFWRGLGRGDGTLQRLLTDPSLYNHLNEAACLVARGLPRLDRILSDLEVFADKLARHPEAIGLGGVLRPGSGLKDAPPNPPWKLGPGH
jgi:phospholipid/cholesterol/gamma-HCH transport system substrate-binding protein